MEHESTFTPEGSREDLQDVDPQSSNESVASSDSPRLSRSSSFHSSSSWLSDVVEDLDFTPLDKLTMFDVLGNLALPQRLEKINRSLNLKKHREKVKAEYAKQKERVIKRTDKELDKLKAKYTKGLDELIVRWNDTAVSCRCRIITSGVLTTIVGCLRPREDLFCGWCFECLYYCFPGRGVSVSLPM